MPSLAITVLLSLPIIDACLYSCLSVALMLEHLLQKVVSEHWLCMPGIRQPLCSNQHGCMGDKGGQTILCRSPHFCRVPAHDNSAVSQLLLGEVIVNAECSTPMRSTEVE